MNKVPSRWLDYSNIGKPIPGTNFIPFKVPLKTSMCDKLPIDKRFTTDMLLESVPNIKIIINLTFTDSGRYYHYEDFSKKSVKVFQIKCPGRTHLPTPDLFNRFYDIVDSFRNYNTTDASSLIGVHCTHGLNRTGLFICKYMVDKLGIKPIDAIKQFETARGHPMERMEYIDLISPLSHSSPRNEQSRAYVEDYKNRYKSHRIAPYNTYSMQHNNNIRDNSNSNRYISHNRDTSHNSRYYSHNSRSYSHNSRPYNSRYSTRQPYGTMRYYGAPRHYEEL